MFRLYTKIRSLLGYLILTLAFFVTAIHIPINFLFKDKTYALLKSKKLKAFCKKVSLGKSLVLKQRFGITLHLLFVFLLQVITPIIVISLLFYYVFDINFFDNQNLYLNKTIIHFYTLYIVYIILFGIINLVVNFLSYNRLSYDISDIKLNQENFGRDNLCDHKKINKILCIYFEFTKKVINDYRFFSIRSNSKKIKRIDLIVRLLNIPVLLINQIGFFLLLIFTLAQIPVLFIVYAIGVISEYFISVGNHNIRIGENFLTNVIVLNRSYFKNSVGNIKEKYYCILIALLICVPYLLYGERNIFNSYKFFLDEVSFNALSLFTQNDSNIMSSLSAIIFWILIILSDLLYFGTIFNFFDNLNKNFENNLYLKPNDFFNILTKNNEINNEYNYTRKIVVKQQKEVVEYDIEELKDFITEVKDNIYYLDSQDENEFCFNLSFYFRLVHYKDDFYLLKLSEEGNPLNYVLKNYTNIEDLANSSRKITNLAEINQASKDKRIWKGFEKQNQCSFYSRDEITQHYDSADQRHKKIQLVNNFIDKYNSNEINTWDEFVNIKF